MQLHWVDWLVLFAYLAFAVTVGLLYARRAGKSVDEYFLSGRSLPWWVAGTSMVATSFAADTPLLISSWVRDDGIWRNWLWWALAISGMLQVFLFARWWRRGEVMTKAELAELRYGGKGAKVLRGFLGVLHAGFTNTIILCWVLLAAAKIAEEVFAIDKGIALALACSIALTYSLLAGFWGVVVTDMVQFAMAMVGAIALAWASWSAVGGGAGVQSAVASGSVGPDQLRFLPAPGEGSFFEGSFWTAALTAVALNLGLSWWAVENVDGAGVAIQRIAASRDERQGVLATLWFNVAHYALRPWCWILVGIASIIVLPQLELFAPVAGEVSAVSKEEIVVTSEADGTLHRLALAVPFPGEAEAPADWTPEPEVKVGASVEAGERLARTDPEKAYVVMMGRYLRTGLLGLVVASLVAAFMSTIDTHVNLASSFFLNDVYRRFLKRNASAGHYVLVARISSVVILVTAGLFAMQADSLRDLFTFFLAFLSGVGPVYVLRWVWWRVRASTELTAMIASATTSTFLVVNDTGWSLGPLSPDGVLSHEGRLILVVLVSAGCAILSMALTRTPDPERLVPFFRKVRPIGAWGPVRSLCPDVAPSRELYHALTGALGALAGTFGLLFGMGHLFLNRPVAAAASAIIAVTGFGVAAWALRKLLPR